MPKYAILDGINIINTIVADSLEIAQEVTGKPCVEFTTELAEPGGTYENGIFIQKKPFPSWVLNEDSVWVSPVELPKDGSRYAWDEETISWKKTI